MFLEERGALEAPRGRPDPPLPARRRHLIDEASAGWPATAASGRHARATRRHARRDRRRTSWRLSRCPRSPASATRRSRAVFRAFTEPLLLAHGSRRAPTSASRSCARPAPRRPLPVPLPRAHGDVSVVAGEFCEITPPSPAGLHLDVGSAGPHAGLETLVTVEIRAAAPARRSSSARALPGRDQPRAACRGLANHAGATDHALNRTTHRRRGHPWPTMSNSPRAFARGSVGRRGSANAGCSAASPS